MQPLAELHVHLEGSLGAESLRAISGVDPEEVRERYRIATFGGFLEAYKWTVRRLTGPEHFRLAAVALRDRFRQERIERAEVNLSVGVMLYREQDARAIIQAVRKELPDCPLIFDAIRQFGGETAMPVAELAAEFEAAFGVGGDESSAPMRAFRDAVRLAGGPFLPHAGETSNARNVWEALEEGAIRIGHGIRAIEDPALCRELRERQIPLEVSLTSNVRTGAVVSLAAHPIRRLFDLGVPVTLNTDDPGIFGVTLPSEYALLPGLGFSPGEVETIRQNAFQFARDR